MTTQTETKKELEQKAQRIWDCYNGFAMDFLHLGEQVNRAVVTQSKIYIEGAEKALAEIEDAIKRYREGKKQAYQED